MKELEKVRDILKDVYKSDRSEAEKYGQLGAGYENLAEYNRGRAAGTALAVSLINQQIALLENEKSDS